MEDATNDQSEGQSNDQSEDKVIKGAALIHAIQEEAQKQGLAVKQVAERFELAPSYWFSMCNGNRSIQALHRHRLKLISKFLNKSYIEILSLAELVEPEDFLISQNIDDQLNLAYIKMKADSMWSPLVPKEEVWDSADRGMKILLVAFYERLFNISILDKAKVNRNAPVATEGSEMSPAVASAPASAPGKTSKASKTTAQLKPAKKSTKAVSHA